VTRKIGLSGIEDLPAEAGCRAAVSQNGPNVGPQWKNQDVIDTRFTTVFDDPDDLLRVVDIDEIGDIETLLMFLFDRPIGIDEVWNGEAVAASLEVVLSGSADAIGSVYDFPVSIIELTHACAHMVDDLGPYSRDGFTEEESADVSAIGDTELITALQQALGKVRLFKMTDTDG
jgi:hypothetical protein